jgi:hypothetical protein
MRRAWARAAGLAFELDPLEDREAHRPSGTRSIAISLLGTRGRCLRRSPFHPDRLRLHRQPLGRDVVGAPAMKSADIDLRRSISQGSQASFH